MRSKLLQCGENTHTLSQVRDTRPHRGVTKLDSARGKKQFGTTMFEFEVFRKQMYYIEESTCDIVWTFLRPCSHSALLVVIRRPGNYDPLPPSLRPCDRIDVSWFCQVLKKMKQLLWQTKTSFLNFRPNLDDCMFKVFS